MDPYVIGMIASDGHCEKNYWSISQIVDNASIIANICDIQKISGLDIRENKGSYSQKERIIIKNKNINEIFILKEWGIPEGNKTYSLSFPEKDNDAIWLYMLGFFEGDGSIYLEGNKYPRASIVSCQKWGMACCDWLRDNGVLSFWSYDKRHPKIGNLYIKQIDSVLKFMNSIYSRKEFANTNKFQKWQEVRIRLNYCQISGRKVAIAKEKKHMKEEATKLLKSGATPQELADKFNYNVTFFRKLNTELGLSKKAQTKRKEKEIESLFRDGKSGADIERMGYSYKLVSRIRNSLYGSFQTRSKSKEEKVRNLILFGLSNKEVCEKSKSSQSYVIKVKKKMVKEGLKVRLNKRRKKDG